jgi:hypothetical protein
LLPGAPGHAYTYGARDVGSSRKLERPVELRDSAAVNVNMRCAMYDAHLSQIARGGSQQHVVPNRRFGSVHDTTRCGVCVVGPVDAEAVEAALVNVC